MLQTKILQKVSLFNQSPHKSSVKSEVIGGDCLEVLKKIKKESVDLIVTSPPYADQRSKTYGGINPDKYVSWFFKIKPL